MKWKHFLSAPLVTGDSQYQQMAYLLRDSKSTKRCPFLFLLRHCPSGKRFRVYPHKSRTFTPKHVSSYHILSGLSRKINIDRCRCDTSPQDKQMSGALFEFVYSLGDKCQTWRRFRCDVSIIVRIQKLLPLLSLVILMI